MPEDTPVCEGACLTTPLYVCGGACLTTPLWPLRPHPCWLQHSAELGALRPPLLIVLLVAGEGWPAGCPWFLRAANLCSQHTLLVY